MGNSNSTEYKYLYKYRSKYQESQECSCTRNETPMFQDASREVYRSTSNEADESQFTTKRIKKAPMLQAPRSEVEGGLENPHRQNGEINFLNFLSNKQENINLMEQLRSQLLQLTEKHKETASKLDEALNEIGNLNEKVDELNARLDGEEKTNAVKSKQIFKLQKQLKVCEGCVARMREEIICYKNLEARIQPSPTQNGILIDDENKSEAENVDKENVGNIEGDMQGGVHSKDEEKRQSTLKIKETEPKGDEELFSGTLEQLDRLRLSVSLETQTSHDAIEMNPPKKNKLWHNYGWGWRNLKKDDN